MAGFDGTWNIKETIIKGSTLIGGNPPRITISMVGAQYRVTIPLQSGDWLAFETLPNPNDWTLSGEIITINGDRYGVRLKFDSIADPQKIVEGPLCSVIERWSNEEQPDDMGTITGQRVPTP